MNKFAQLGADIAKLWLKYGNSYFGGTAGSDRNIAMDGRYGNRMSDWVYLRNS